MGMDHISMASIMNTVEGFLGQHWIALATLGHDGLIQLTQFHIVINKTHYVLIEGKRRIVSCCTILAGYIITQAIDGDLLVEG